MMPGELLRIIPSSILSQTKTMDASPTRDLGLYLIVRAAYFFAQLESNE